MLLSPIGMKATSPSQYGGKQIGKIGDTVTYELTFHGPNTVSPIREYLANGSVMHYQSTSGIKMTYKIATINKSASGNDQFYLQRSLYLPNNGTYKLIESLGSGFFNYAFTNAQSAKEYYLAHYLALLPYKNGNYTNANGTNTVYYHFVGSDLFFIADNSSVNSSITNSFMNSYYAYEFNWKTGWEQTYQADAVSLYFKWVLIDSHSGSNLPGLTVFSIIPPFAVLVPIVIKKRKYKT